MLHAVADVYANKIESGLSEIHNAIKDDARIDVPEQLELALLSRYIKTRRATDAGIETSLFAATAGWTTTRTDRGWWRTG